jgi:4,5-dihydroxyphthalate decarboxylase
MGGSLNLVLACWDYDRTRALQDGRVKPEGIDLTYLPLGMPESFFRMLRHGEFHVSEMSLSWYTRTLFTEPRPFIAIPVFPSRMFRHSSIYVNAHSGIREPADLIGRRVGCPEYQMTAAVWIKGILADYYGVPVDSVTYVTGGLKEAGRRETPMDLPERIRIEHVQDQTLSDLLEAGDIDALYTAEPPVTFVEGSPNVRRLFEDHAQAEKRYFAETGVFPIMHTVVIRRDLYERDPWVAQSLTKAFLAAQRIAYDDLAELTALKHMLPWLLAELEQTRDVMGADFWPYGLERNRHTLDAFLRYSHEQGLSPQRINPEELFAPETLDTAKT